MAKLLRCIAQTKDLILSEEITRKPIGKKHRILYDGILIRKRDTMDFGYWRARDHHDSCLNHAQIEEQKGYSLVNTLFENTQQAVLYQDGQKVLEAELSNIQELEAILKRFFSYDQSILDEFQSEKESFASRIQVQSKQLFREVQQKRKEDLHFAYEFGKFHEYCKTFFNSDTRVEDLEKMLVQHILTEGVFQEIFLHSEISSDTASDIPCDILQYNRMGSAFEGLLNGFSRRETDTVLRAYYERIARISRRMTDRESQQRLFMDVYEVFFQNFNPSEADRLGIKYTPKEIVDFMLRSIEWALNQEFAKTLGSENVSILDPCVGTGTFMTRVLEEIAEKSPENLIHKYRKELHANEIELLPYYIATLSLQSLYHEYTGLWEECPGICFADSLDLLLPAFETVNEESKKKELVKKEFAQEKLDKQECSQKKTEPQDQKIFVILGNPPYNAWQKSENQANQNKKHQLIDSKIKETYVKGSCAKNKNSLYDVYVKFFRFATDQLKGKDGILCFVSNNSFLEGLAFDGFRKEVQKDFQRLYHLDLGGNIRKGHSGNVFKIRVGVGMSLFIQSKKYSDSKMYYYRVDDKLNPWEKLEFLEKTKSFATLREKGLLREIKPNEKGNWFTEKLGKGFEKFLPLGSRRIGKQKEPSYFDLYSTGVMTNRDRIAYDFNSERLKEKIALFMQAYNQHVDPWQALSKEEREHVQMDHWVENRNPHLKWDRNLKRDFLKRGRSLSLDEECIRESLYRPFVKQYLYFERGVVAETSQFPKIFPKMESRNLVLCVSGKGFNQSFDCLLTDRIPERVLLGIIHCFPLYRYERYDGKRYDGKGYDGKRYEKYDGNRKENISDYALDLLRSRYKEPLIEKLDLFYYLYAVLQHSRYRDQYQENLRLELARVPLVSSLDDFWTLSDLGKRLGDLHLNYETGKKLDLPVKITKKPVHYRVDSMELIQRKSYLRYNETLSFHSIEPGVFEYRVANRSPIEWIVAYYKNWIPSQENPSYLVDLIQRLAYVSVKSRECIQAISQLEL